MVVLLFLGSFATLSGLNSCQLGGSTANQLADQSIVTETIALWADKLLLLSLKVRLKLGTQIKQFMKRFKAVTFQNRYYLCFQQMKWSAWWHIATRLIRFLASNSALLGMHLIYINIVNSVCALPCVNSIYLEFTITLLVRALSFFLSSFWDDASYGRNCFTKRSPRSLMKWLERVQATWGVDRWCGVGSGVRVLDLAVKCRRVARFPSPFCRHGQLLKGHRHCDPSLLTLSVQLLDNGSHSEEDWTKFCSFRTCVHPDRSVKRSGFASSIFVWV